MAMVSIAFFMALFSAQVFGDALAGPPADLASLLDPKATLERLEAPTDEDSLIGALGVPVGAGPDEAALKKAVADLGAQQYDVRQAAARVLRQAGAAARAHLEAAARSDDPEVRLTAQGILGELNAADAPGKNMAYVRKLMTIRLLAQMKSQRALPALRQLAAGGNVTLADAAGQAVAAIEGGPSRRPSGTAALAELAARLPADTAFVVMLNAELGSSHASVRSRIEAFMKGAGEAGNALPFGMPGMDMGGVLEQMLPEIEKGITDALARTGNIRVDAAVMIIPKGIGEDSGYVAWVIKGLCEPERVALLLANALGEQRQFGNLTIYYEEWGSRAVCLLDSWTLVISMGPGDDGSHIEPVLNAMTTGSGRATPAAPVARALEIARQDKVRLALWSTNPFGVELRTEAREELLAELQGAGGDRAEEKVERAFLQMIVAGLDFRELTGDVTADGRLTLQLASTEEKAAELGRALTELQGAIRGIAESLEAEAPPAFKPLLEKLKKDLWTHKVKGDTVTLEARLEGVLGMTPLLFLTGRSVQVRERRAIARPVPMEEVPVH